MNKKAFIKIFLLIFWLIILWLLMLFYFFSNKNWNFKENLKNWFNNLIKKEQKEKKDYFQSWFKLKAFLKNDKEKKELIIKNWKIIIKEKWLKTRIEAPNVNFIYNSWSITQNFSFKDLDIIINNQKYFIYFSWENIFSFLQKINPYFPKFNENFEKILLKEKYVLINPSKAISEKYFNNNWNIFLDGLFSLNPKYFFEKNNIKNTFLSDFLIKYFLKETWINKETNKNFLILNNNFCNNFYKLLQIKKEKCIEYNNQTNSFLETFTQFYKIWDKKNYIFTAIFLNILKVEENYKNNILTNWNFLFNSEEKIIFNFEWEKTKIKNSLVKINISDEEKNINWEIKNWSWAIDFSWKIFDLNNFSWEILAKNKNILYDFKWENKEKKLFLKASWNYWSWNILLTKNNKVDLFLNYKWKKINFEKKYKFYFINFSSLFKNFWDFNFSLKIKAFNKKYFSLKINYKNNLFNLDYNFKKSNIELKIKK